MKGILRITLIINLVLALLLAGLPAAAEEAPPTLWEKTFGSDGRDWGEDVIQTSDAGYLTVGSNWSIAGYSNLWVIKTDSNGEVEWDKKFGGEDPYFGISGLQTEDGGYAIFGYYMPDDWDFHQLFIIQLDSSGNKQWEKLINETVDSRGEAVIRSNDGGFAIVGTYGQYFAEGGDASSAVIQSSDGSYVIAGVAGTFGNTQSDVYLIKVAGEGTVTPGDANGDGAVNALDITQIERIIVKLP